MVLGSLKRMMTAANLLEIILPMFEFTFGLYSAFLAFKEIALKSNCVSKFTVETMFLTFFFQILTLSTEEQDNKMGQ